MQGLFWSMQQVMMCLHGYCNMTSRQRDVQKNTPYTRTVLRMACQEEFSADAQEVS